LEISDSEGTHGRAVAREKPAEESLVIVRGKGGGPEMMIVVRVGEVLDGLTPVNDRPEDYNIVAEFTDIYRSK
jgi:hypothetical protein